MPLLISIFLILILHGCGGGSSTSGTTYATAIGDGTSITRTDDNSIISEDALKNISEEVGNILKTNIISFNKTQSLNFNDETSYCDISGLKESSLSTNNEKVSSTINYNNCYEAEATQNGKINLEYIDVNNEGKCPKCLQLKIDNEYTFNDLKLSKDVNLESDITYDANNTIQSIEFKISGNVTYKNENYKLHNIRQIINY